MMADLYIQHPKTSKEAVRGQMTHNKTTGANGRSEMLFWQPNTEEGGRVAKQMINPEIVFCTSRGIMFRGWEPSGVDKTGREILKYQEWYLAF